MKKIIIALFSLLAMFQLSCNPIEEEHKQGSVIAESELKLDVYPLTEGGNKIVMINNTPMVGSHWNYGSGISVRQQDTVLVPFLGEKEIVFTGICAGGTISTTRKVTIDNILYPIEDEWAIFAGTDKPPESARLQPRLLPCAPTSGKRYLPPVQVRLREDRL